MGAQQSRQLLEAASTGDVQKASQLLMSVPVDSTDDDAWTALHFSSWAGRALVVKELLNHSANARARDKRGRMPIHLAALRGQTDVIALLCDHGCPLNDVDADGTAPLHKALGQGHVEAAQHLLAYGADAKQILQDGTTALHLAAYSGKTEAVELLIRTGASVHAQNCDGQTPLFEAAAAGHLEVAKVLLNHGADADHKDRERRTAADRASPQVAAFLLQPGLGTERPAALWQASAQQPDLSSEGRDSKQGGFMSRLWDGLPSLGVPGSSASSAQATHQQATADGIRQPSVHRTPEGGKQDTEPGIHLGSLPSAPPLPEHQTHALHAASSSLSPGPGNAQHTLNPSLHASTHSGACVRPSQSQTRQEQGGDQQRHTPSMGAQTGGGSLGPATGGRGQEGVSTEASPAVQPAGSLAWAMQTAAGAPRAAVSALSAWLPWHADSSTSSAPQPEQQLQPQAGLQAAPNSRRYGLQPGDDFEEEDEGEQPAAERLLANDLQDMSLSSSEALSFRVFRQEELFDATRGFDEAANRLDRAGSPNEAFLGALPTISSGTSQHTDGMQVVVRGYRDIHNGQARLNYSTAAVMAEVKHPNILPLVGVCTDNGSAVYDLMESGSLEDALHGRRPKLAAAPVRLDWVSRTRIAAETASALMHLHSLQPSGFAHGGLRPSCILLDRECSAHVGDAAIHAVFGRPEVCDRAADVFALGVVMLQLLTGSEAHGLAQHAAEVSRAEGAARLVDPCAGDWPLQAASEFCSLAVRCTAWRAEERPSLSSEILPALSRLVGRAEGAAAASLKPARLHDADPPAFLLCPITQELFEDPVVCADGYTYSQAAIAQWLRSGHNTSPMTNLSLSSRELRPNFTLRSAAMEWQEARQAQQQ